MPMPWPSWKEMFEFGLRQLFVVVPAPAPLPFVCCCMAAGSAGSAEEEKGTWLRDLEEEEVSWMALLLVLDDAVRLERNGDGG